MRRALLTLVTVLCLSLPAMAEDREQHGSWSSQFLEGMGEATTHDSGTSTFGILCAEARCRYYFANGVDCEPGGNYPFMITTDAGALTIEGVCEPVSTANGDVLVYWFNENDVMNRAFLQTPVVGFAFPLTDGKFKLSSFSMEGYKEAVERMVTVMRDRMLTPGGSESQEPPMDIPEVSPDPPERT